MSIPVHLTRFFCAGSVCPTGCGWRPGGDDLAAGFIFLFFLSYISMLTTVDLEEIILLQLKRQLLAGAGGLGESVEEED